MHNGRPVSAAPPSSGVAPSRNGKVPALETALELKGAQNRIAALEAQLAGDNEALNALLLRSMRLEAELAGVRAEKRDLERRFADFLCDVARLPRRTAAVTDRRARVRGAIKRVLARLGLLETARALLRR